MADFAAVRQNIKKLLAAGAPDEDIDAYVREEGFTPEEITGPVEQPAWQYSPENGAATAFGQQMANVLGVLPVENLIAGIGSIAGPDKFEDLQQQAFANTRATQEAHPVASGLGTAAGIGTGVAGGLMAKAPIAAAKSAAPMFRLAQGEELTHVGRLAQAAHSGAKYGMLYGAAAQPEWIDDPEGSAQGTAFSTVVGTITAPVLGEAIGLGVKGYGGVKNFLQNRGAGAAGNPAVKDLANAAEEITGVANLQQMVAREKDLDPAARSLANVLAKRNDPNAGFYTEELKGVLGNRKAKGFALGPAKAARGQAEDALVEAVRKIEPVGPQGKNERWAAARVQRELSNKTNELQSALTAKEGDKLFAPFENRSVPLPSGVKPSSELQAKQQLQRLGIKPDVAGAHNRALASRIELENAVAGLDALAARARDAKLASSASKADLLRAKVDKLLGDKTDITEEQVNAWLNEANAIDASIPATEVAGNASGYRKALTAAKEALSRERANANILNSNPSPFDDPFQNKLASGIADTDFAKAINPDGTINLSVAMKMEKAAQQAANDVKETSVNRNPFIERARGWSETLPPEVADARRQYRMRAEGNLNSFNNRLVQAVKGMEPSAEVARSLVAGSPNELAAIQGQGALAPGSVNALRMAGTAAARNTGMKYPEGSKLVQELAQGTSDQARNFNALLGPGAGSEIDRLAGLARAGDLGQSILNAPSAATSGALPKQSMAKLAASLLGKFAGGRTSIGISQAVEAGTNPLLVANSPAEQAAIGETLGSVGGVHNLRRALALQQMQINQAAEREAKARWLVPYLAGMTSGSALNK